MKHVEPAGESPAPEHGDSAEMPASRLPRTRAGRSAAQWFVEGLLILMSVALGYAMSELHEWRENRALAGRVLEGLRVEVERNLATVEPYVVVHQRWSEALSAEAGSTGSASGIEVFIATRPTLPPGAKAPIPAPRSAAWDTALSTGALRLIDYDAVAGLSEIYELQRQLEVVARRIALDQPAFFDPAHRTPSVKLARWALEDIAYIEGMLVALYREQLSRLQKLSSG